VKGAIMGEGSVFLLSWFVLSMIGFIYKKSIVTSIGGGFIATCFILIFYITVINPKTMIGNSGLPPGAIDAKDIYSEYDANAVAADQKYKNKIITVYGKVESIDTLMGYAFVTLKVKIFGGISGVQCGFYDKNIGSLASLSKGQNVAIEGKCSGRSLVVGVQLSNCRIIKILS
jgi:hypothetical protein